MSKVNINGRVFLLVNCTECNVIIKRRKSTKAKNKLCRVCNPKSRIKNNVGDPAKPSSCIDCSCNVCRGSIRCKPCSAKHRTNKLRFCIDCSMPISRKAEERCLSCHNKKQDKGLSRARTKFNASKRWSNVRAQCFKRDLYTCQNCGDVGGTLNAHHIKHYATHEKLRLDINNIITVCVPCHRRIHFG